jgi:hypothetical protein
VRGRATTDLLPAHAGDQQEDGGLDVARDVLDQHVATAAGISLKCMGPVHGHEISSTEIS